MKKVLILILLLLVSFATAHEEGQQGDITSHYDEFKGYEGMLLKDMPDSLASLIETEEILLTIRQSAAFYVVADGGMIQTVTKIPYKTRDTTERTIEIEIERAALHDMIHSDSPRNRFLHATKHGEITFRSKGLLAWVKLTFLKISLFFAGG
tara:strand:- start:53 stop:508 length:456 start_codon:yes stop_codon:yes gene_type:complete